MNEHIKHLLSLPDTPRYNIKAVVQQTSVNISTLRAWEQRYGIPNPKRSEHGTACTRSVMSRSSSGCGNVPRRGWRLARRS